MAYKRKPPIRFVHALPNAWFPAPGKSLVVTGISPEDLAQLCQEREIVSHIRYDDHASRISKELGIELVASATNSPSPWECDGLIIVASLSPGTTDIKYVKIWDATACLAEAQVFT